MGACRAPGQPVKSHSHTRLSPLGVSQAGGWSSPAPGQAAGGESCVEVPRRLAEALRLATEPCRDTWIDLGRQWTKKNMNAEIKAARIANATAIFATPCGYLAQSCEPALVHTMTASCVLLYGLYSVFLVLGTYDRIREACRDP